MGIIDDGQSQIASAGEHSNVTIIKFGGSTVTVLAVGLFVAVLIGLNCALSIMLWNSWNKANIEYTIVRDHTVNVEHWLEDHANIPPSHWGEPLPKPEP